MVKKGIIALIDVFLIICGFLIISNVLTSNNNELRIRILANSNSEEDLKEKEIVKNALEKILNESKNYDVDIIKDKLNSRLPENLSSKIKVERVNSYFPAKSYNGKFIPSGNYKTLLITIGEGKGSNFWTMLYPEYYHIEFEENNEIEYRVWLFDFFVNIFGS